MKIVNALNGKLNTTITDIYNGTYMYNRGAAKRSGNVVTVNYAGDITKLTANTQIIIGNVGDDKIPTSQIAAPCYFTSYANGQVIVDKSGDISVYANADISTRTGCRFSVAYIV